jgi:chromosome segregation ATPase
MTTHESTINALADELTQLEHDISRLRLIREKATYKLEQALREQDRLSRHLAAATRDEGAA